MGDTPEHLRVLLIIVCEKPHDAVAPQVVHLQLLPRLGVVEICYGFEVGSLHLAKEAVVVPAVLSKQQPDTAEDIAEIGIVEAEADKQECLGYEIALQRQREYVAFLRV